MKIVVQNPLNNLYFAEGPKWVPSWQDAHRFGTTFEAVKFCTTEDLEAYRVLMKNPENDRSNIALVEHVPTSGKKNAARASKPSGWINWCGSAAPA
jgi:hypothetical protein